jgi:hypothetical protein
MAKAVLKNADSIRNQCLYQAGSPPPIWHADADTAAELIDRWKLHKQ